MVTEKEVKEAIKGVLLNETQKHTKVKNPSQRELRTKFKLTKKKKG